MFVGALSVIGLVMRTGKGNLYACDGCNEHMARRSESIAIARLNHSRGQTSLIPFDCRDVRDPRVNCSRILLILQTSSGNRSGLKAVIVF